MVDDRYPIGPFKRKETYTTHDLKSYIQQIAELPANLTKEVKHLSDNQLDTPYRDGGWTIRQVIHHLPDSHLNAYVRMKWTLTEDRPLIKAYDEKAWAETSETKFPPEVSLSFLDSLHSKWVALMLTLSPDDLKREFVHPETNKPTSLDRMIAMYAWHSNHHLAHVTKLKEKMGWQ